MATIYLIRHCESEGNACRRAQAQTDALVTRKGYAQNEALRQHFSGMHIDALYASDSFRAIKTVEPIAKDRGLDVNVRFLLREITTGIWEDMAWGNIAQDYPEEHKVWTETPWDLITPGAGQFKAVGERMLFALRRIAKDVGPAGVALVSSHSCSIKAALCLILGRPIQDVLKCGHGDNCSVSKLTIDENGTITAEYTHDSSFLPAGLTRAWSGVAGADVNMAVNPCRLPEQKDLLLALASADAGEREEAFDPGEYLAQAEALLQKQPNAIALAFLRGKAVGYVRMGTAEDLPGSCGLVSRMYMIPSHQGKGYGEQLLGYATHEMRYGGKRQVAIPKACTTEEQRIADRFLFEDQGPYQVMDLFCPHLDYPVLP